VELHLDTALVVADGRTREMVPEDPVSDDDDHALHEKQDCGDRYADVEIVAEEGFVGWEVAPGRITAARARAWCERRKSSYKSRRNGRKMGTRRRQSSDVAC
jgi:hypothetical protein